jgi:type VI secretion system secreted protein Hcp
MKTIITKLAAFILLGMLVANIASATPIYMKIEGVDGESQVAEVNPDGTCSFKIKKPGKYSAALLLPAVQKVRESANRSQASDDKHKEWIEVLSWSWGASNPSSVGSTGMSSGREASTPSVSEIVVTKQMDKSTPKLAEGVSKGKTTQELKKQTTHNGETYYQVKLTDVMVSSWQSSGGDSHSRPMESISLNFTKIEFKYTPVDADKPVIPRGMWDLQKGTK